MSAEPKSAAEIAAASPDPRVRGAGMRRLEIEREKEDLDAFLNFYAEKAADAAPAAASMKTALKPAARVEGNGSKTSAAGKTARMVEAACKLIAASNAPMTLDALWENLGRAHPGMRPSSVDSLRARLSEHKASIRRVDERGYWPTILTVPPVFDA